MPIKIRILIIHPVTPDEKLLVPESERRNFSFRQGNESPRGRDRGEIKGLRLRHTTCTPHKKNRGLTPPGRKSTSFPDGDWLWLCN